jgi:hypothetical protein
MPFLHQIYKNDKIKGHEMDRARSTNTRDEIYIKHFSRKNLKETSYVRIILIWTLKK